MKKSTIIIAMCIIAITFLATGCQKLKPEPRVDMDTLSLSTVSDTSVLLGPSKNQRPDAILEDREKTSFARMMPTSNESFPVTLYIDTDGENNVPGASWGISGNFNCPKPTSSQLPSAKKDSMWKMVVEDFSTFNVVVVKTLAEFQNASGLKMQIILTNKTAQIQASPILSGVPGAAYISSILWQNGTVCFVFINEFIGPDRYKKIAEAITHELGHVFGLFHQKEPNTNFEYRFPSSNLLYGAIMGNGYQAKFVCWIVGPSNSLPSNQLQNDAAIIGDITGWKESLCSGTPGNNNPILSSTVINSVLVYSTDQQCFYKDTPGNKTITVKSGGNVKFKMKVLSSLTDQNPTIYDSDNYGNISKVISGKKWIVVYADPQLGGYASSPAGGTFSIKTQ